MLFCGVEMLWWVRGGMDVSWLAMVMLCYVLRGKVLTQTHSEYWKLSTLMMRGYIVTGKIINT